MEWCYRRKNSLGKINHLFWTVFVPLLPLLKRGRKLGVTATRCSSHFRRESLERKLPKENRGEMEKEEKLHFLMKRQRWSQRSSRTHPAEFLCRRGRNRMKISDLLCISLVWLVFSCEEKRRWVQPYPFWTVYFRQKGTNFEGKSARPAAPPDFMPPPAFRDFIKL